MAESWCAASGPALQELWEEPDQNATALLLPAAGIVGSWWDGRSFCKKFPVGSSCRNVPVCLWVPAWTIHTCCIAPVDGC